MCASEAEAQQQGYIKLRGVGNHQRDWRRECGLSPAGSYCTGIGGRVSGKDVAVMLCFSLLPVVPHLEFAWEACRGPHALSV